MAMFRYYGNVVLNFEIELSIDAEDEEGQIDESDDRIRELFKDAIKYMEDKYYREVNEISLEEIEYGDIQDV